MKLKTQHQWLWLVILSLIVLLSYWLGSILTPFLIGGLIAYLFNPFVNRLNRWHIPRSLGVLITFVLISCILFGIIFLLIPILEKQFNLLFRKLPDIIHRVSIMIEPWVKHYVSDQQFQIETIKSHVLKNWVQESNWALKIGTFFFGSAHTLFVFLGNTFLVIVVSFYLLRDWNKLITSSVTLLKQYHQQKIISIFTECGEVLASFFRGQLWVMICLAIYYAVSLKLVHLDIGILLGILTGLLSIVPYVGFGTGLLLSLMASLLQNPNWVSLISVLVIFGIGQVLESFILVPVLVGGHVGLHPIAVIFAILVSGKLFGLIGVLWAVPLAAIFIVLLRHLHEFFRSMQYARSDSSDH